MTKFFLEINLKDPLSCEECPCYIDSYAMCSILHEMEDSIVDEVRPINCPLKETKDE